MVHLRIVAPPDRADAVVDLLCRTRSAINVVRLPGAAVHPEGDVVLCDVAREDASVVLDDLKALDIPRDGSVSVEDVDTTLSMEADRAVAHARGLPADAVVWEAVEQRTEENVELSAVFVAFMVLAALLAAVAIHLDSAVLLVGAMVVGPEFGPIAGLCVALVQRRPALARRSGVALVVGFPLAVLATFLASLVFKVTGVAPERFSGGGHELASIISHPDFLAFFVAACAACAGMLSLSTAKSGALIGVLISVTTIPAAANVGLAAAYGDWDACVGSLQQLGLNLAAILLVGTGTLTVQRALYGRRRARHLREAQLAATGSPATTRPRPSS